MFSCGYVSSYTLAIQGHKNILLTQFIYTENIKLIIYFYFILPLLFTGSKSILFDSHEHIVLVFYSFHFSFPELSVSCYILADQEPCTGKMVLASGSFALNSDSSVYGSIALPGIRVKTLLRCNNTLMERVLSVPAAKSKG